MVTETEAKAAGVFSGWTVEPGHGRFGTIATGAVQVVALPGGDPYGPVCFQFWRSRSGYRKACRMLRRSGRVIMHGAT